MTDDFSADAHAAFDKLAALKRRYQQESDPVPELEQAVQIDAPAPVDLDDIPILTEAVLILDEPMAGSEALAELEAEPDFDPEADLALHLDGHHNPPPMFATPDPPDPRVDAASVVVDDALLERLVARLRPELEMVIQESVKAALAGQGAQIYEAWLAGLRQRTAHLLDEGEDNTSSSWS